MKLKLPTDEDTNLFFCRVVSKLEVDMGYPHSEAFKLVQDYYANFTNSNYCKAIGVPVQDDDFFFHESENGMALRIHYYLKLKLDPSPRKFVEWRTARRQKH